MEYVWIEKDKNIKDILNEEMKVHVKWSKKADEDYLELSRQYMNASYMIIKEIEITSDMGLKLLMEDDLFVVKLYENSLSGYKESVVYKCKVSDSSVEEMIEHINKTHKIIMQQQ